MTCPHAHAQNGIIERKYRHIVDTGLVLLAYALVSLVFWPFAFAHAVYLTNILPSSSLNNYSPYLIYFRSKTARLQ